VRLLVEFQGEIPAETNFLLDEVLVKYLGVLRWRHIMEK
jgi:hypothetical protein